MSKKTVMENKKGEMEHSKESEISKTEIVEIFDDNDTEEQSKSNVENKPVNKVENANLPVSKPENTIQNNVCVDVDTSIINLDNLIKDFEEPKVSVASDIGNKKSLEIICVDSDDDESFTFENKVTCENESNVSEEVHLYLSEDSLQESVSKNELQKSAVTNIALEDKESADSYVVETPKSTSTNISIYPQDEEAGIKVNSSKNETNICQSDKNEKKKCETVLAMQVNKDHGLTKPDVMIHIPNLVPESFMESYDLSQESGISSYDIDSPLKEVKAFAGDDTVNKNNCNVDNSLIENMPEKSVNEQKMDIDPPNLENVQDDKLDPNVLAGTENILTVDKPEVKCDKEIELSEESNSTTSNLQHTILDNKHNTKVDLPDYEIDGTKSNESSILDTEIISKMEKNKLENDTKKLSGQTNSMNSTCNETPFIQRVNVINIERLISQKSVTSGTSEALESELTLSQNIQNMDVDEPNTNNVSNTIIDCIGHDSIVNDNETKSSNLLEPPIKSMEKSQFDANAKLENVIKELNQPSTSYAMEQNEEMEVEDSLGLLAESSRVMEDDEDQDQEDEDDASPDDDDGEFDADEESNVTAADHLEDSSAHQSESAVNKEQQGFMETTEENKIDEIDIVINEVHSDKETTDVDFNELAAESQNITLNEVDVDTEITIEEGLIKTSLGEQIENTTSTVSTSDMETVKLSDSHDQEEPKSDDLPTDFQEKEALMDSKRTPDSGNINLRKRKMLHVIFGGTTPTSAINADEEKLSPSHAKKLCIAKPQKVFSIVDLEESSSEDDEANKNAEPSESSPEPTESNDNVTSLHIPKEIEIMSTSGGTTSEIVTRQGEVVISGVPKPKTPYKTARLNTSEVTIKTVNTNPSIVIPETKIQDNNTMADEPTKHRLSLEVFNVDSDEEEKKFDDVTEEGTKERKSTWKCINSACKGNALEFVEADPTAVLFYDAKRKKRPMICSDCAVLVDIKIEALVDDFMGMKPLLHLDPGKLSEELVEISDSDSDDEGANETMHAKLGEESGQFLEDNLLDKLNSTWAKYNMDQRLKETNDEFLADIERVEEECKKIDELFHQCQLDTDKLRNDFYATFEPKRKELQAIIIFDTPLKKYTNPEYLDHIYYPKFSDNVIKKTSSSSANTPSSNSPSQDQQKKGDTKEDDDNMDVSVVELSKEAAPADLPPPGEMSRPPLEPGQLVYAMRTAFGSWTLAHVVEVQATAENEFTTCRVRFDGVKSATKTLAARCIAYNTPADVRMTIGTRLIALFKDPNSAIRRKLYYSGVVAEMPNPVNNYRYLVFFDDGYAQYVPHRDTRLVCECSVHVWEEVHPYSRQFVHDYLKKYPERPMVRLHKGQNIKTEWNGKWWVSRVMNVDASLVQVYFEVDNRTEWIYRGSTRLAPLFLELQAAERHRNRPMPRSNKVQTKSNMPYVEYTQSDEQKQNDAPTPQQSTEEIRRQRAVAKKSTSGPQPAAPPSSGVQEAVTSRVVYYTPKNAVKPHKMVTHICGPKCKRTDVLTLKELRTYNPLTKPLLSGWERQLVKYKNNREVMYRAPCGRRIRNMPELHRYLRATHSDMPVDLFDFGPSTHCLAEFVLNRCRVSKKDLSHGKENVPVPCVNYYDDTLPDFCSYNTERTPTTGVPLNLDPEFLCGCDCTDDCQDKSKCACWKMTLEGARTINLTGPDVGYVYKRLPEPLPSGIYECNSRCKCKDTCLNRVAQFPLQLKLQVFKTLNRGWGIRALNDVPKGAFLCVYAGNLLTDATANLDGLNEGDEYLAELDYIEVVEQMKEGYEEDIPDADKELDKSEIKKDQSEEEELSSSEEEATSSTADKDDDDFRPAYDVASYSGVFKKTLRKRERRNKNKKDDDSEENGKEKEKEKEKENDKDKAGKDDENCITISDDEEAIREPSRFAAESSMSGNEFISKYRSLRSYFGKDEACYIMDAKVQGNIGRYLNHSCCPNVFVQNVFVDTHDPRFPWVAFFALSHIRAGTELTWNYNYDIGSVPGKILYCKCGAANCRRRLL